MLILIFATLAALPFCASQCEQELKKCGKHLAVNNFKPYELTDREWSVTYIDEENLLGLYKNEHCVRDTTSFLKGSEYEVQLLSKSGKRGKQPKIAYTYGTFETPTSSSVTLRHYSGRYSLHDYQAVKTDYKTYIIMILCAVVNDKAIYTGFIYQRGSRTLPKKFIEDVQRELYEKSKLKIVFAKQSWEECDKEGENN